MREKAHRQQRRATGLRGAAGQGEKAWVLEVYREVLKHQDLKRKVIEVHRRWRKVTNCYELLIKDKGSGMSLIQDLKREKFPW